MSMVVSELSRELVASPNKEVDTDPGNEFAILFFFSNPDRLRGPQIKKKFG